MSELSDPKQQRDLEGGLVAHGRKFDLKDKSHIDWSLMELIPWEDKLPQLITVETPEFSAVCPFSGLPDIARLKIEYVPSDVIIELRGLKYTLTSFRNVGIYQEEATDLIAQKLQRMLAPLYLKVSTVYNVRGGFLTTAEVEVGRKEEALKGSWAS